MNKLLQVFLITCSLTSVAQAAVKAKVILVVGGSPCTGGPTNCIGLTSKGKVIIKDQNGVIRKVAINNTGVTAVSLVPATYKFIFETTGVGSSEEVDQDIVSSTINLVSIKTDTGIR